MVRALASHQCGPGSIPVPGFICELSMLLVLILAPSVFLGCSPVFLPPQKSTLLNSNSIWKQWMKSDFMEILLKTPTYYLFYLFIYLLFSFVPERHDEYRHPFSIGVLPYTNHRKRNCIFRPRKAKREEWLLPFHLYLSSVLQISEMY